MSHFRISTGAWKLLVVVMGLIAAGLMARDLYYASEAMAAGETGTLGWHFLWDDNRRGSHVISGFDADSPLAAAGARVGDLLVLDHLQDDMSKPAVGQAVGLTLVHDGVARHVVVRAVAKPINGTFTFRYLSGVLGRALCIVFALLVAFKQPTAKAYRAIVLYFLLTAFNATPEFSPPGTLRVIMDHLYWATFSPALYFVALFAVHYPDGRPTGLRARIARGLPVLLTLSMFMGLYFLWWAGGHTAPWTYYGGLPLLALQSLVILVALADGWRTSTGASRQRHAWLLVAIGTALICSVLTGLPLNWEIHSVPVLKIIGDLSTLFMDVGIAYAVLRHRVFDFGFVVNRAIFYSAASLLLLVAFGIVEWLSEHLLHFEAREANVLVDGAIALGVYLVFHRVRHAFEHGLERLFFHKWHQNEAGLRQFVKKAAHFATNAALVDGVIAELRRFSGGAGCALYQQDPQGDYALLAGAGSVRIGVDDDIAVSLRTEQQPVQLGEAHGSAAQQLALPMAFRGDLRGFILLGAKPDGAGYRPDEMAVLGWAAQRIGADLHALHIVALLAQLDARERQSALDAVRIEEQQRAIDRLYGTSNPAMPDIESV